MPSLPTRERGLKPMIHHDVSIAARGSLPTRERGLKRARHVVTGDLCQVAPHAGAWIETDRMVRLAPRSLSLPTRERGLTRHTALHEPHGDAVAPHAGAWIETSTWTAGRGSHCVAPHAGAWIETPRAAPSGTACGCRSPRGSVD